MKKSNENTSLNCDDVERLLIHRIFDGLTPEANLSVEKHLKSCDRCRSYQKTLLNLQDSMQISTEEKLVPDPAIRQNIIRQMKTLRPVETGIFAKGWLFIRSIFAYRVPVYQPLAGVVLIVLIFLAGRQLPLSPGQKTPEPLGLTQIETPTPAQMSVINNLRIIEQQKIGRNVKEDSTLTRFIVTTM
ncbi:MAG: hypothetical protein AMJ73_07915 [candidate division Zixibacteria bacterium SM1_73]|nr:MAG: hypothetical protein AMJ73_07915 [candidate division Zixibacteria bacterium SM1_73]